MDRPITLLEVLFARQVWQLAVLPDTPSLDVARADVAVRPLDFLTVAQAKNQCEALWGAYLSWRSEMQKRPTGVPPPSWRSKYGYADLDERVMRDFVGQVRHRTMTDLRRYGPVTVDSLRARFGERIGVPPDEVTVDVLPLDRRLHMQITPSYVLTDLGTWI